MNRRIAFRIGFLVLVALAYFVGRWQAGGPIADRRTFPPGVESGQQTTAEEAHAQRLSEVMLEASGRVERILADDNRGSRHQRFIVRLESGHTLLVSHNIDLAERVPVDEGDRVAAYGQYEWNDRGGVLHWTHRDPDRRRAGGWIRHHGHEYR